MHYIGLYTDNLLFVSPDLDDIRRIKDGLKREYGKDLGETKFSACGGEPKTREHFLPHCPLYASQRATLLSSIRLKSTTLAYLLSDPRATKATLRFLANSGRFDSLYSPPSEDPPIYF